MDRESKALLQTAVADLREITRKLEVVLPSADGSLRDSLLEIRSQSEASIRYYSYVLAKEPRPNMPAQVRTVVDRAAQAAFGGNGVGLTLPHFVAPNPSSDSLY